MDSGLTSSRLDGTRRAILAVLSVVLPGLMLVASSCSTNSRNPIGPTEAVQLRLLGQYSPRPSDAHPVERFYLGAAVDSDLTAFPDVPLSVSGLPWQSKIVHLKPGAEVSFRAVPTDSTTVISLTCQIVSNGRVVASSGLAATGMADCNEKI